ncbi:MAG: hypothetical protein AAFX92_14715 [Pseudomonadota bacterium]
MTNNKTIAEFRKALHEELFDFWATMLDESPYKPVISDLARCIVREEIQRNRALTLQETLRVIGAGQPNMGIPDAFIFLANEIKRQRSRQMRVGLQDT